MIFLTPAASASHVALNQSSFVIYIYASAQFYHSPSRSLDFLSDSFCLDNIIFVAKS